MKIYALGYKMMKKSIYFYLVFSFISTFSMEDCISLFSIEDLNKYLYELMAFAYSNNNDDELVADYKEKIINFIPALKKNFQMKKTLHLFMFFVFIF
jgi:hypothetical protein